MGTREIKFQTGPEYHNCANTGRIPSSVLFGRYNQVFHRQLPVLLHGEFAPTEFALTSTQPATKCLKFLFLLPRKKDNIVRTTKQNDAKHAYFSFFNPLKVTDKLEIESSGCVHGGERGRGELAMGRNRYHSHHTKFKLCF